MKRYLLVSIKVHWLYQIWLGIKKAELRKSSPKELWENALFYVSRSNAKEDLLKIPEEYRYMFARMIGKIVASFSIFSVESIFRNEDGELNTASLSEDEIIELTCVAKKELNEYIKPGSGDVGYVWKIQDFEILEEYKELKLFTRPGQSFIYINENDFLR